MNVSWDKTVFGPRPVPLALLVLFYGAAGTIHVMRPDAFLPIVPGWVPEPRFVVILTGLCEIAGVLGLLIPRLRGFAGVMLALYAVCVFPANIKHAVEAVHVPPLPDSWWYHGPRLLAQPIIVWWALFASGVLSWPFRSAVRKEVDRGGKPAE